MTRLKTDELKKLSHFRVRDKFERDDSVYLEGVFEPPYPSGAECGYLYVLEPKTEPVGILFDILWTARYRDEAILELSSIEEGAAVQIGANLPCAIWNLRQLLLVIDLDVPWKEAGFRSSDAWTYESSPGWRTILSPGEVPPVGVADAKKVPQAWDHEHCVFCMATISDDPDYGQTVGYVGLNTFGNEEWVCRDCYECRIVPHSLQRVIKRGGEPDMYMRMTEEQCAHCGLRVVTMMHISPIEDELWSFGCESCGKWNEYVPGKVTTDLDSHLSYVTAKRVRPAMNK